MMEKVSENELIFLTEENILRNRCRNVHGPKRLWFSSYADLMGLLGSLGSIILVYKHAFLWVWVHGKASPAKSTNLETP